MDKDPGVSMQRTRPQFLSEKEILPFATTRMNVEPMMLSERSQTQKDILDGIADTSMWNLKKSKQKIEQWLLGGGISQRVQFQPCQITEP